MAKENCSLNIDSQNPPLPCKLCKAFSQAMMTGGWCLKNTGQKIEFPTFTDADAQSNERQDPNSPERNPPST